MKNMNHPSLEWAHPLIQQWFVSKVGFPTEPQIQGWPSILAGKTTLISAPTGSGKTFAAFLACIDNLVRRSLAGNLEQKTEVIYISPLKALSNDIQKNLLAPLKEIAELAKEQGYTMQEITVAVRTGDTLASERQAMLKKPPHILVTTPESFYILLTAEKSRAILASVKTVIVDEIHAMLNDKRGTHLALSLERLEAITANSPTRIGLSATQKPIDVVAHFLSGTQRPDPTIVNIGHIRELDLGIVVPQNFELAPVASNEMWDEIYDRLTEFAQQNRSTLVFVNTRRLAERVAHHLSERLGETLVAAHHGSLSRKIRFDAETRLKNGELKVLVATASLELGIDIGSIDLVCQIGSPRAIAAALQRIGRAGHWHGAISKGRLFATTRDELIECAALVQAIHEGDLDKLIIPVEPNDILAQQIIATCATGDWNEDELFSLVKRAAPYANLTREKFNSILEILSSGIAGARGRYGTYLFRDQVNGVVKARRGSRLAAITSGGAIPENGLFTVIAEPNGTMVGTLDEDFAVESNRGDIILLGTTSWIVKRVESKIARVLVEDAKGAPPSVPFWRGEAPGRTNELSVRVANLRQKISDLLKNKEDAFAWLQSHCGLDQSGAEQILEYIKQGIAVLGAVPTQQTVIAERFFDEAGGMQLIIHAPFGARINKAWGLALRKKFCRSFNFELQAAATDDGINIALAEQHSFPLSDVFQFLNPKTIENTLQQAVLQSPLFPKRWRAVATRSLALLRFRGGKKVPPNIQRMLSDDLLAAVFPDASACQDNLGGRDIELPDHPLIEESMKDVMHEALDLEGFKAVLTAIAEKKITCLAVDTPVPSVFSHEILNANPYAYLDDAPLEERRARAVEMRRILPGAVLEEVGRLDQAVIAEVQNQAWPDVRNPDELHDVLQTLIAYPADFRPNLMWQEFFSELTRMGRAGVAKFQDKIFWFATEKAQTFKTIYPNAVITQEVKQVEDKKLSRDEALLLMLRGWMLHLGPATNQEISHALQISITEADQLFLQMESSGYILRGNFRTLQADILEWCERRLLARIHRLTVGKLREEIKPVTAAQYVQWLLAWQHLTPGSQLKGENGLLEVLKKLQGFELPAKAWESQIFAKRIQNYDPDMLDRLCLTGVVGWGRISPHSSLQIDENNEAQKKIMPSSIAPITFFLRENADWMLPANLQDEEELLNLSHAAKAVYRFLKQRGASFLPDIIAGSGHLSSEVDAGLWELVAAGLVTADGFDNLRALINPRRRLGKPNRRRPMRFSSGRWSLLYPPLKPAVENSTELVCRMLLKRYGVVFRDLLEREKNIPRWRELLIMFRRLEDRGEVRGGRFVDGFLGEQFALPYAVESLRALRKKEAQPLTVTVSAVDPLNLVGIILPGDKVAAYSGNDVVLKL